MTQRMPHFAGSWYPDSERECLQSFAEYEDASQARVGDGPLVGGIVPHAGWYYSGQIAYNVVREVAGAAAGDVDTVVLFGGHLGPANPITVMTRGDFWTPLGPIPTDEELADAVAGELGVEVEDPQWPERDNTVELQAPIIKQLIPGARMVVIKAPPNPETLQLAQAVVRQTARLQRRLVVFGSTDLTHYGPNYGWAPHGRGAEAQRWVREENDRQFVELTRGLDPEAMMHQALVNRNACCPGAAAAAVECGRQLGANAAELLIQALSTDISPTGGDSFVGYAGIVF